MNKSNLRMAADELPVDPCTASGRLRRRTQLFAVVALAIAGSWVHAADPKPAELKQATTKFEKPPFWWGSEAFRHNGYILDSDLSTDGKLLATASWESFAVWELPAGKKLLYIQDSDSVSGVGSDRVSVVRLSPDGKQIATANKSLGTVCTWDVATGKHVTTIAWDKETERVALEKAGAKGFERRKHLADYHLAIDYLDNTHLSVQSRYFTTTWDTAKVQRVSVDFHPVSGDFGITKDRKRILRSQQSSGGGDGIQPALLLWDVAARKAVREFPIGPTIWDTVAALSDDQRYLAVTRKAGKEIALWDWKDNKEVAVFEFVPGGQYDSIRTMEFAADSKTLYVGSSNGNLTVYDLLRKAKVRSWKACANYLMRIHLVPGGKTLYTVGGDGLVHTLRLPEATEVPIPEGYIGHPEFAWSRARNIMVVGDQQGRIDLWDATGSRITRTLQTKGEPIVQLAFSHSGRRLAASDWKGTTRLWSFETGDQIASIPGTEGSRGWAFNVLQISDDETKLLVRTGDLVKMYLIPAGKELWSSPKQMAKFALSPNGKIVCAFEFQWPGDLTLRREYTPSTGRFGTDT